jgi:hypothetical protein
MRLSYNKGSTALAVGLLVGGKAFAADSPLQVILDGRAAADSSNLTESGLSALATSGGNLLLLGAGLIGIVMVAMSLLSLYQAHGDEDVRKSRSAWVMLIVGSLATIPAIVAAIIPFMMGI